MGENISGISYLDNIELLPVTMGLSVRSKKEILDRLLIDYTIASIATYAFCSSYDLIKTFLNTLDNKMNISSIIESKDKELLINIYNKRLSSENLEELTYRFESANLCAWFLGLSDNITYKNKCSVKVINDLILNTNTYKELLNKCNTRSVSEIINYYSVIAKVIYSNTHIDETVMHIIDHQDKVIKYIVIYNFNKNGLKVRYSKEDLKFEFELPEGLKFVNLSMAAMFALKGSNNTRVLAQEITGSTIQDNVKKLKSNGFEVLDVNYLSSLYLEKRIVKVSIARKETKINSYYVYLSNHLIRFDFSENKMNIDSNVIYSIKTFE